LQKLLAWLKQVVSQPSSELDRWQRAVRFCSDLSRVGARQLSQDRAPEMAAALSFRTLFGLLPVLVVASVLVKSVAGMEQFLAAVDDLFALVNLQQVHIILPSQTGSLPQESVPLSVWLRELLGQAATINVAALGWVGLAVLIYAAISLLVTIEDSFNVIYRAPGGRSWSRRIPLYWFVLTISPLALALIMLANDRFSTWIDSVHAWQWLLHAATVAWTLTATWLFMFAVYMLMPNTTVRPQAAAVGSLVTVTLLEIGKRFLGAYLEHAFAISQLYGSLGLIPLFMFWTYLMWLFVLFGLEVSAILQALPGHQLEELERKRRPSGVVEPASVIVVMEIVGERFAAGAPATAETVSELSQLPEPTVSALLDELVQAGLLHRIQGGEEDRFTLARPAEQIAADTLLDVGYRFVQTGERSGTLPLLSRLRSAQRRLAGESNLASVLAERTTQRT
jgi:membrane protein